MTDQIKKIQRKLARKGKKNIRIKKMHSLWVVSQNGTRGPVHFYNQRAWKTFVDEIMSDTNDDLFADQWI